VWCCDVVDHDRLCVCVCVSVSAAVVVLLLITIGFLSEHCEERQCEVVVLWCC